MGRLTINEIIAKREQCVERLKTKYCDIHIEFLGGDMEFHSLSKKDMAVVREQLKMDKMKGLLYFVYLSADDLRDKNLLKAYDSDKKENYRIVEKLFTEAERSAIIEILEELNGLNGVSAEDIHMVQVEEIKN